MRTFLFVLLAGIPWAAEAQNGSAPATRVRGPVLGYVFDPAASRVRPIFGMAGASRQGQPLDMGLAMKSAALSPQQDSLLATADGVSAAVALELAPDGSVARHDIQGSSPALRNVAYTPNGRAAALWAADAHNVQIVVGLPSAPALASDLDVSFLAGTVAGVALSDAGTILVAVNDAGGGTLYRFDGPGAATALWTGGAPGALVFVPGFDDALLADTGRREIYLVRSVTGAPLPLRLAGEADGVVDPVAVGSAGGKVFAAMSGGTILGIDPATGSTQSTPCRCRPSGLERLAGNVFRLTAPGADTMWLLDGADAAPRLVFVPPPEGPLPRPATATRGATR